jgi:hypothetical protein
LSANFLTAQEVDELNYRECCQHLKLLRTRYDFEQPLLENFRELWPIIEPLTDTILYLEDRISRFEDPRIGSMDKSAE